MSGEILAKDVDAATRRKTAALLERKLAEKFVSLGDVVGMLQLMLVADDRSGVISKAGRRVHAALHGITHAPSGGSPMPTDPYGHGPGDVLPKGTIFRWQFHEVHRASLPLTASSMRRQSDRERIIRNVINTLRIHDRLLRLLFINVLLTHNRRLQLRAYMRSQSGNPNRGQILVNIINFAANPVSGTASPALMMMGDLFAVVIGNNMLLSRGSGQYFGSDIKGATGFKPVYRDRHNQIQHAVAGLVLGHRIGLLGTLAAMFVDECKDEPQDVGLYWASYKASRDLNDQNYKGLSERVRSKICDNTVTRAP